jgi:hypothetical protein
MTQKTDLVELERSIKCDRVISEGQLLRHHGLTLRDLGKRFIKDQIVVEHSSASVKAHKITMISVEPLNEAIYSLRHAAGIAEIRHRLQVPPESWLIERRFEQSINPDAVWQRGEFDRVAIEYDVCNYSVPLIAQKVNRFAPFNGQIWATVSRSRIATLRSHLGNLGVRPRIFEAQWW